MTAIPHGRPPFRHPGCSGHCAAQNPTPLSTLKFHDWRSSGRRFAGHFVSGYTDDVRFGSLVDICSAKRDVRFAPESGHVRCTSSCPQSANSGHRVAYSITSSARASNVGGIARPMALAALRLITKSNLVGCSTGRSAGLVPVSILSDVIGSTPIQDREARSICH